MRPVLSNHEAARSEKRLVAGRSEKWLVADRSEKRLVADRSEKWLVADRSEKRLVADKSEKWLVAGAGARSDVHGREGERAVGAWASFATAVTSYIVRRAERRSVTHNRMAVVSDEPYHGLDFGGVTGIFFPAALAMLAGATGSECPGRGRAGLAADSPQTRSRLARRDSGWTKPRNKYYHLVLVLLKLAPVRQYRYVLYLVCYWYRYWY